jgi:hypothetical protein
VGHPQRPAGSAPDLADPAHRAALRILWPHASVGFNGIHSVLRILPPGERAAAFVRQAPSYRCPKNYGSFFTVMVMALVSHTT